jgi:hypothetical protein
MAVIVAAVILNVVATHLFVVAQAHTRVVLCQASPDGFVISRLSRRPAYGSSVGHEGRRRALASR